MQKIPPIMPISDIRKNSATVLNQLKESQQHIIITQRGRAVAVMQSIEEYERMVHDRELLFLLAQGEKEISLGDGYDLKNVMDEADNLLQSTD